MSFKKVTHVIFDIDGTLLGSETIYDQIISDIAKPFGKIYGVDTKVKLLGTPELDTARIAVSELDLPISPDEFLFLFKTKCKELLQDPPLMPGAKALVEHLHENNIPIAVATSSTQSAMEAKTKNHQDVFKLFHHIVSGSSDPEVKNGKPAPDIFLVGASRFPDKPDPSQCLVVEDSPNGVQAAIKAGMQVVLVPEPYIPEELRKPATLVINSLSEFKPEIFGLPARRVEG